MICFPPRQGCPQVCCESSVAFYGPRPLDSRGCRRSRRTVEGDIFPAPVMHTDGAILVGANESLFIEAEDEGSAVGAMGRRPESSRLESVRLAGPGRNKQVGLAVWARRCHQLVAALVRHQRAGLATVALLTEAPNEAPALRTVGRLLQTGGPKTVLHDGGSRQSCFALLAHCCGGACSVVLSSWLREVASLCLTCRLNGAAPSWKASRALPAPVYQCNCQMRVCVCVPVYRRSLQMGSVHFLIWLRKRRYAPRAAREFRSPARRPASPPHRSFFGSAQRDWRAVPSAKRAEQTRPC